MGGDEHMIEYILVRKAGMSRSKLGRRGVQTTGAVLDFAVERREENYERENTRGGEMNRLLQRPPQPELRRRQHTRHSPLHTLPRAHSKKFDCTM